MHWISHIQGCPRRVNHAAVAYSDFIYSFGGYSNQEDFTNPVPIDINVLQIHTLRWYTLPIPSKEDEQYKLTPYRRYGHTCVLYNHKIYLWGGRNDGPGACNKLYCFDPYRRQWSIVRINGFVPEARDGHSACVIKDRMYIFAGFEEPKSPSTPKWRDFHTSTSIGDLMYVFGGRFDIAGHQHSGQNYYENKLHVYDSVKNTWTEIFTNGQIPGGRRSHSAFSYKDKLYIWGGYNSIEGNHYNDFYEYSPETQTWAQLKPNGMQPKVRRRQCCVVIGSKMYLFGGTSPISATIQATLNAIDIDQYGTTLVDQNDLFVLDFTPTLKTLCLLSLANLRVKIDNLPSNLREDLELLNRTNRDTQRPTDESG